MRFGKGKKTMKD